MEIIETQVREGSFTMIIVGEDDRVTRKEDGLEALKMWCLIWNHIENERGEGGEIQESTTEFAFSQRDGSELW